MNQWGLLAAMGVVACATAGRSPANEVPVGLGHATVTLKLDFEKAVLTGDGQFAFTAPVRELRFDAKVMKIESVSVAGDPVRFSADDRSLTVFFESPSTVVQLRWSVALDPTRKEAWFGYGTERWMPTIQDPAQRMTLALRVVPPPGMQAVASGTRQGADTFVVSRPTPPFLFAFAVGELEEATLTVDGVTVRALGPAPASRLTEALEVTAATMRLFASKLGVPYPFREYTTAFVRGSAAQESVGLALIGAGALDDLHADPTDDWVFSHELAHQWFGVAVPCADFGDFWLNEGFATFMVGIAKESRFGRAAYDAEVAIWQARSGRAHESGQDAPVSLFGPGVPRRRIADRDLQARAITYFRGALVLHRLRSELGDTAFWAGLHSYVVTTSKAGRATSEDLRMALEASSGRDLKPFFKRYVYSVEST